MANPSNQQSFRKLILPSEGTDLTQYQIHSDAHGVKRGKYLNRTDLTELVKKAQEGDKHAKDEVVRQTYMFVQKRVRGTKKWGHTRLTQDDLLQCGMLGLLRAIELYDVELGFAFTTYATHWIDQFIAREIENSTQMIRTPTHVWNLYREMNKTFRDEAYKHLFEDAQGDINSANSHHLIEETFKRLEARNVQPRVSRDVLELCYDNFFRQGAGLLSLDTTFASGSGSDDSDEGNALINSIADSSSEDDILDEITKDSEIQRFYNVVKMLPKRERYVIIRRFGLVSDNDLTLDEVGQELGVTRERIRQIEAQALRKLKHLMCRGDIPMSELLKSYPSINKTGNTKFTVPESVVLSDRELEILNFEYFPEVAESKTSTKLDQPVASEPTRYGRVPKTGPRFQGRIMPDWFNPENVRKNRTTLLDSELTREEMFIREMNRKYQTAKQQRQEF